MFKNLPRYTYLLWFLLFLPNWVFIASMIPLPWTFPLKSPFLNLSPFPPLISIYHHNIYTASMKILLGLMPTSGNPHSLPISKYDNNELMIIAFANLLPHYGLARMLYLQLPSGICTFICLKGPGGFLGVSWLLNSYIPSWYTTIGRLCLILSLSYSTPIPSPLLANIYCCLPLMRSADVQCAMCQRCFLSLIWHTLELYILLILIPLEKF